MVIADRAYPGRVAIIGAGMAGAACAATLAGAGIAVEVFEKSGGVGGRLSNRQVGGASVDIGAQYVTVRGKDFRAIVDRMIETGVAAPWQPTIRDIRLDDGNAIERRDPWFVGLLAMSALATSLVGAIPVRTGCKVTGISAKPEGWFLALAAEGSAGPFSSVAVTAPAPHTLALIGDGDPAFAPIADVGMSPCWTLACVFERPVGAGADVVRPSRGAITWSARNQSKPGRDAESESWVIHGDPIWSFDHLEDSAATVTEALLKAFAETVGTALPPTIDAKAHRWRNARVETPVGASHLLSRDGTLGAAGDWCVGARVEAAFDSGRALGKALVARLRAHHPEID